MVLRIRNLRNLHFHLYGNVLDVTFTDCFRNLFKNYTFFKARKHSYDWAQKAMHLLDRI